MITAAEFSDTVANLANDGRRPNDHQVVCVGHPRQSALMVAGS